MQFNVALIGCGAMGKLHAQEWNERSDSRIAAVFDINRKAAEEVAAQSGAAVCNSYEEAILKDDINVVAVCTPANLHPEISIFAINHRRHVHTEKAMSLTLQQADAMIAAAEKNNVKLGVSYQFRCEPRYKLYHDLIQNGDFGGPIFARFVNIRQVRPKIAMHSKSQNGGSVIDMGGHFFDLMRYFTKEEPLKVYALGHVFGRKKKRLESIKDFAIDAADILVSYSGGHSLSVFINWGMPETQRNIGAELLTGPELSVELKGNAVEAQYPSGLKKWEKFDEKATARGQRIADFVHAIIEDREPEVSGKDGKIALAVCLAALKSIETGEIITLSPYDGKMLPS